MKKFLKTVIAVLVLLLFSPLIVFSLFFAFLMLVYDWLREPGRKRKYRASHYYKDFQAPYEKGILYRDSYQFYNEAKAANLSVNMVHPTNGAPDYLIAQDAVYLFPMCPDVFGGIAYHTLEKEWKVDFDGDLLPLQDEWENYKGEIGSIGQELPCYLLLRQCDLNPCFDGSDEISDNYAKDLLPSYVCVVARYIDFITGLH